MPLPAFRRQPDQAAAERWFATRAGQAILASEAEPLRVALGKRPGQAGLWFAPAAAGDACAVEDRALLRLHAQGDAFTGDLACRLPLPLASESCGLVVMQHLTDLAEDPEALLEECSRVLIPGGWLWLLALNPLSPYRLRWRGQGLRVSEPVTWRRRLRGVGLVPDAVSQGLGPIWDIGHDPALQDGAGLRCAFLLRAEKRRSPMTPVRASKAVGWRAGTA